MRVTVNGEMRDLPEGSTLSSLVESLGLRREALVAEVNRTVLPAGADKPLAEGDRVELIQFVGGG